MGNFWKDLLSAAPVVGGLAGGAIERGQSRRAIERQNEYNKPINQLARLREAGLPFAAMTDAISGNQSQPQETGPSGLGQIEKFNTTRQMQKTMELLEAQIDKTKAEGEGAWKDAGLKANALTLSNDMLEYQISSDGLDTDLGPYSRQIQGVRRQRQREEFEMIAKGLENDILEITKKYKGDEMQAHINNLLDQNKLLQQQFKDHEAFINWKNRFMDSMQGGTGDMRALIITGLGRILGLK